MPLLAAMSPIVSQPQAKPANALQNLLEQKVAAGARDTETYFLLGMIAMEKHEFRKAIMWFRMALVRDPRSARLRLELGRAFYLAKDYTNAELQFERALAGDLPAAVQANARHFLDRIRREKRWSFDFSLALAPDTNINLGSSARETVIFGLPFQLGKDAKMRSGVGFMGETSIEFSPRLDDRLRWRSGIALHRSEYKSPRFNDTIASGWSGPQWIGQSVEISVAATALRRWYGGTLYQQAFGGRIQVIAYRGARTAFLLGGASQYFRYPTNPAQSGPVWSANLGVIRIIDPTTSVALLLNGAVQKARARDLANRSAVVSLSATHDFRGGFTLSVAPTYVIADYDAPDVLFGNRRRDRSNELQITLLNRRAMIWRFTPTVTYTRMRRSSSISLYDSRQDRLEIGLTSAF